MPEIRFSYHVLRSALMRKGLWILNQYGVPKRFVCRTYALDVRTVRHIMENQHV